MTGRYGGNIGGKGTRSGWKPPKSDSRPATPDEVGNAARNGKRAIGGLGFRSLED